MSDIHVSPDELTPIIGTIESIFKQEIDEARARALVRIRHLVREIGDQHFNDALCEMAFRAATKK